MDLSGGGCAIRVRYFVVLLNDILICCVKICASRNLESLPELDCLHLTHRVDGDHPLCPAPLRHLFSLIAPPPNLHQRSSFQVLKDSMCIIALPLFSTCLTRITVSKPQQLAEFLTNPPIPSVSSPSPILNSSSPESLFQNLYNWSNITNSTHLLQISTTCRNHEP